MNNKLLKSSPKSAKSAGEITLDVFFQELHLWRKMIPKDGNCLFRIASDIILGTQVSYEFIETLFKHYQTTFNTKNDLKSIINYIAKLTKKNFSIFWSSSKQMQLYTNFNFTHKIVLCTVDNQHFDLVLPMKDVDAHALCQSLLYEMLYDKVFQIEDSILKAKEMLKKESIGINNCLNIQNNCYPTLYNYTINNNYNGVLANITTPATTPKTPYSLPPLTFFPPASHDSTSNCQSLPQPSRAFFPYKVAKSLSVDIYRNVEYDAWLEGQKIKEASSMATTDKKGMAPGDKCQVVLSGHDDKTFNAYIQEIKQKGNEVVVFVEGLGEKHTVEKEAVKMVSKLLMDSKKRPKTKSFSSSIPQNDSECLKRPARFNSACPPTKPYQYGLESLVDAEEGLVGDEYSGVCESNESVFYESNEAASDNVEEGVLVSQCCQSLSSEPCNSSHFMLVPAPNASILNPQQNYPSPINYFPSLSTDPMASDLPDVTTCRYFFNLGVMTYKGWMMIGNQLKQQQCLQTASNSYGCHQMYVPSSEFILLSNASDSALFSTTTTTNGDHVGGAASYAGAGMTYYTSDGAYYLHAASN